MNIPNLNVIKRLWNQKSGVAQRRLALKKEKLEEANMETHRVSVTVTDPNHSMSTMRKEKIEKRVRVQARDKQHAIDSAIHHYKKAGYRVHDHNYIGKVEEEVAANNVGNGNIAGTQGDAGKKPVMNKKPLKRFKDLMEK